MGKNNSARPRMKRWIVMMAAVPVLVSGLAASDLGKRLSLRFAPGGIMALGGHYSDTEKLSGVVSLGAGLGLGLRYQMNENFILELGYDFCWIPVKGDNKPFAYKEQNPALNLQMLTANGIFFLMSGYRLEPYLTLGAGLYPWEFSQVPIWGSPWPAPAKPEESFSDHSLAFNIGLGVDAPLSSKLAVFAELKYHYIFSRNPGKFGTDDFTQQDFLGLNMGFTYSFGGK
jgi:opacity protein-like surface antigen